MDAGPSPCTPSEKGLAAIKKNHTKLEGWFCASTGVKKAAFSFKVVNRFYDFTVRGAGAWPRVLYVFR